LGWHSLEPTAHTAVFGGMALASLGLVLRGERLIERSELMPLGSVVNQIPNVAFLAIHFAAFLIGARSSRS
jgi:ABC-type nitrate/sulfonate/bicarbonate transport system permease component